MKVHIKALVVTIGVSLLLVVLYYRLMSPKGAETEVARVAAVQTVLPVADLVLLDGKMLNLKSFTNKVIVFNFWASWCAPCIEEVPSLISLVKADPNIVVIAVSGDQNKDDIAAFLKSFPGFNRAPIYVVQENAKAIMEHFKVDKLPESFIFNTKGEMVKKISGTINWHTPESIEYFKVIRTK